MSHIKDIAIIGAGGFGKEVKFLIDRINKERKKYKLIGFYDDAINLPSTINGLPLLGDLNDLLKREEELAIVIAIGIPSTKKNITQRLKHKCFDFPTLVDPNAIIGENNVKIGKGTIICAGNIITTDIKIGDFVTINLSCTIGHDTEVMSYSSFMPSVNISGEIHVSECVYVGTGAKIINQLRIGVNSTIGAGAVIIRDVPDGATVVGNPGRIIKIKQA